MLVNLELALLGIFLCFSFYSVVTLNPEGQLYAILILVAAAAESAIGLALVLLWSRTGEDLNVCLIRRLKS